MQTSESTKEISTALLGFHKQVGKVRKTETNPFFKSKYADLSSILDVIAEPLTDNGLVIVQFPEGENALTTRLLHTSGEWMESTYTMKPVKNDPQGAGSVITYQRRYAIGAVLSLNIDADDDANKASTPAKQIPIKTAVTQAEEIKQAIVKLLVCEDVDELKMFKTTLPDYVKTNQSFKDAAKKRYNEVTGNETIESALIQTETKHEY